MVKPASRHGAQVLRFLFESMWSYGFRLQLEAVSCLCLRVCMRVCVRPGRPGRAARAQNKTCKLQQCDLMKPRVMYLNMFEYLRHRSETAGSLERRTTVNSNVVFYALLCHDICILDAHLLARLGDVSIWFMLCVWTIMLFSEKMKRRLFAAGVNQAGAWTWLQLMGMETCRCSIPPPWRRRMPAQNEE